MIAAAAPEVQELLRGACKRSMLAPGDEARPPILDRAAIEAILPHRDPFLLIDRITRLDRERGLIVAHYDLARADGVFAGHFPGAPVWPGVLQVEAIGQAGAVLAYGSPRAGEAGAGERLVLTHILGAQFVRPILPGSDVVIAARLLEDGLFTVIVGQCLQEGQVCSGAAVRGIGEGGET